MRVTNFRARFGIFSALIALLLMGTGGAIAAPSASAPATVTTFSANSSSRFGVVTHIATRFGHYGQQNGPMDVASGTGAGWIREEIRWDWVEHPLGQMGLGLHR